MLCYKDVEKWDPQNLTPPHDHVIFLCLLMFHFVSSLVVFTKKFKMLLNTFTSEIRFDSIH